MTLRPARPDEAPQLTALATAAKRHWGYPEAWINQWAGALTITPDYVRSQVVTVVEDETKLLGFSAVVPSLPRAILDHLWVQPGAMGRGLGRRLFARAEADARLAGATVLHVTADPHAEEFYRKMGLVTVGHEAAPMNGQARHLPLMEKKLAG